MLKKIKAIIDHPFAAPLTETVKGIAAIAFAPVRDFGEAIARAFDDNYYSGEEAERPKMLRVYSELLDSGEFTGVTTLLGMLVGGVGAAIAGGIMAAGAGFSIPAIVGVCAASVGIGVAAGPFAVAAILVTGAATVGSVIGGVPGFIKGCSKVIDHFKHGKAQAQVSAALPPTQAQDEELTGSLARALAAFNDLPKEQRATYVKMMNQQHMDESWHMNDKLLKAFDSMADRDKAALVKGLRDRLSAEFTELAKREANDSTVLQNEITVDGPLKLKKPQAAA
ncbi:MAG: hypothetical protein ACAH80_04270 [Alphaproteobacteria bacterium]